jgi:hypothetical protein
MLLDLFSQIFSGTLNAALVLLIAIRGRRG